ncbi:MAG: hypothetical protein WCA01_07525 [Burkholderiales bacterium]
MSSNEQPVDPVRDLAEKIYVELVGRAFRGADDTEQFKPDPKAMTILCFKLADAFVAGAEAIKKAGPEKFENYQAQDSDVLRWLK